MTRTINIHGSSWSVWHDLVDEEEMKRDVFDPLIRVLRRRGWSVRRDPEIHKRYRCLSPKHRYCRLGELEANLSLSGRHLGFEMFQNVANVTNPNGGRYDFGKMERMPYLTRKRAEATINALNSYFTKKGGYPVKRRTPERGPGGLTGEEWIQAQYANSWHHKEALGRPDFNGDYNRKSADGHLLEHHQRVFFVGPDSRWRTGIAWYNINNMWWVLCGRYDVRNLASFDLYTHPPATLRERIRCRRLKCRAEQHLNNAIRMMDFVKAEAIRRHLYGEERLFRVFSEKNGMFYAAQGGGYTQCESEAGRYTAEEIGSMWSDRDLRIEAVGA